MTYIDDKMKELSGVDHRRADSVRVVSLWYIPEGYKVDQAEVKYVFFSDVESAEKFEKHFSDLPEAAVMSDLTKPFFDGLFL